MFLHGFILFLIVCLSHTPTSNSIVAKEKNQGKVEGGKLYIIMKEKIDRNEKQGTSVLFLFFV